MYTPLAACRQQSVCLLKLSLVLLVLTTDTSELADVARLGANGATADLQVGVHQRLPGHVASHVHTSCTGCVYAVTTVDATPLFCPVLQILVLTGVHGTPLLHIRQNLIVSIFLLHDNFIRVCTVMRLAMHAVQACIGGHIGDCGRRIPRNTCQYERGRRCAGGRHIGSYPVVTSVTGMCSSAQHTCRWQFLYNSIVQFFCRCGFR
jgi:hypothetical protein